MELNSLSVAAPSVAIAFGSIAPPQGDVVFLNVHLGCTREVSSFEVTLQNWNGKYSPNGAYPLSVGLDGNISVGRGATCPQLITCRVENIKYQSTPLESYVTVSGRCWGERLFRRVVSKIYENKKGEEIVKDLLDYYIGVSHVRGNTELVEATDTTYTRLQYEDTPVMDVLRQIADSADKAGAIGYDFRVAPDGKFEFFPKNAKYWAPSNLALYLPFDEVSGATAFDHSNKGNSGTVTGASRVNGKYGRALSFDGNDYVRVATNSTLQNFTSKTVLMWVKRNTPTAVYQGLFDNGYWVAPYGDIMYSGPSSNAIAIYLKNSAGTFVAGAVTVTPGEWTQIGYVWDGTSLYTVKNGVLTYVNAFSGTMACSAHDLYIGTHHQFNMFYDGLIDEVKIFSHALSQAEISDLYTCGPPPLSEKIEKYEYTKQISGVRNRTVVYGAADKSVPQDKDLWTESLSPADGAWTATSGAVSLDTAVKIKGNASIKTSANNLYCGGCVLTLNSGSEVNANLYPTVNLSLFVEAAYNGNATVTLFDTANRFAAHEFTVGSDKWFQTQLQVGNANADLWQVQTDFDWTQIKKVAVSCWFVGLGTGNFWVDSLFFGGRQYSSTQEDAASQSSYGLREIVEVNEELCSDVECESHAKAVLTNLKDPSETLTIQSTIVDYGSTPILAGDKVNVYLPNEGVSGDFRVLSVEYTVDGKTQTLELTLELGREKPLLADYVYALRSRTDHLSRYKTAKQRG